jgi:quercetin dioxygenase-like cupin family protein
MQVTHLKDIPTQINDSALFTAPVTIQSAITEKESDYNISYVHFPKGVRNKFHTHTSDQVLIVTEGKGIVATETEEKEITVGDVVLIKAGEKHWHGAVKDTDMTHIALTKAGATVTQQEA